MSPKEMTKAEYVKRIKDYIKNSDHIKYDRQCPATDGFVIPAYCNEGQPCDLCGDFISLDQVMIDNDRQDVIDHMRDEKDHGLGCPCFMMGMIGKTSFHALILTTNAIQEWKEKKHKWQKKTKTKVKK